MHGNMSHDARRPKLDGAPRDGRSRAALLAGALAVGSLLFATPVGAQTAEARAAAQALFDEAKELAKDGKFAQACPKFEESQRLESAPGTQFKLADCYEQIGKTASAWANFLEVAATSRRAGQADREQIAQARAKTLEPKLTRLLVSVAADGTPGLEVKRDGNVVKKALWGTPIPVDPGTYRLTATAPGRAPWSKTFDVAGSGWTVTAVVPELAAAGSPSAVTPSDAPVTRTRDADATPSPGLGTQRIAGIAVAGIGVVGVGLGAAFGIMAIGKNNEALENCRTETLCSARGLELTNSANSAATVATIGFIAGGAAIAGGAVLFFTAKKPGGSAHAPGLQVRLGASSVGLAGRF
jgi:hypothetical protein